MGPAEDRPPGSQGNRKTGAPPARALAREGFVGLVAAAAGWLGSAALRLPRQGNFTKRGRGRVTHTGRSGRGGPAANRGG